MKISIICAMDSKRGIGKNNDLLFRIKEDFVRMRRLTTGHPIIMGRKTFESIGRALPDRTNIIVTGNPDFKVPADALVAHALHEAIELAKKSKGADEFFIFGGGQIFKEALPIVDRLYLTLVKGDFGADVFFPDYSEFKKVVYSEKRKEGDLEYEFIDLER